MAMMPDGPVPVNRTPARLAGRGRVADLSCWDVVSVQRDMGHKRTGAIRQELDSLRCLPPLLREHLWTYVLALGLLACDRAMVLEACDQEGGEAA